MSYQQEYPELYEGISAETIKMWSDTTETYKASQRAIMEAVQHLIKEAGITSFEEADMYRIHQFMHEIMELHFENKVESSKLKVRLDKKVIDNVEFLTVGWGNLYTMALCSGIYVPPSELDGISGLEFGDVVFFHMDDYISVIVHKDDPIRSKIRVNRVMGDNDENVRMLNDLLGES